MNTCVVNTAHGTRCDVDIMRPSKWGNPFIIGRDGDRATCIINYKKYLANRLDLLKAIVPELTGKVLGCCCSPQVCHGDYLAHLANNPEKVGELIQAHILAKAMSFAGPANKPMVPSLEPELLTADSPEVQAIMMAPAPKLKGKAAKPKDDIYEELAPCSGEQEAVLQAIMVAMEGEVHLIVGRAGAGKSHIVKHLVRRVPVTVCATTAKAALLVGGLTLDRLFCYSRQHNSCWDSAKLDKQMRGCAQIIVIDEGSMAGEKMADYVYSTARVYGKILVIVGDWAQAAPVEDKWFFNTRLYASAKIHHLTESHRQNERAFLDALDALRSGKMSSEHYAVFQQCVVASEREVDDPKFTRVAATNQEVDQYNQAQMAKIPRTRPDLYLDAFAKDLRDDRIKQKYPRKPGFYQLKVHDSPMANGELIRLGSRVMITLNLHRDGYVNSDLGVIVDAKLKRDFGYEHQIHEAVVQADWDEEQEKIGDKIPKLMQRKLSDEPAAPDFWASQLSTYFHGIRSDDIECLAIRMDRTGETFFMYRAVLESADPGQDAHTAVIGFPIALAWACTGHKVQGSTLDNVYVKMESILRMRTRESMHGLAYVMLSRCRTLAGLKISRWVPEAIHCDPECLCLIDPSCEAAVESERQRKQARLAEVEKWNKAALGRCDCCGSDFKHVQICNCGRMVCRDCAPRTFPDKCPRCANEVEDTIHAEAV